MQHQLSTLVENKEFSNETYTSLEGTYKGLNVYVLVFKNGVYGVRVTRKKAVDETDEEIQLVWVSSYGVFETNKRLTNEEIEYLSGEAKKCADLLK